MNGRPRQRSSGGNRSRANTSPMNQPRNQNRNSNPNRNANQNPININENPLFGNANRNGRSPSPHGIQNQNQNDVDHFSAHSHHTENEEYDDENDGFYDNDDDEFQHNNDGEWNEGNGNEGDEYYDGDEYDGYEDDGYVNNTQHPRQQRPPRPNQRAHANGANSHFQPAISENHSPIVPPRRGRAFDIRPQYLNALPHFMGDKAKKWFLTLPANSIRTWAEMQQAFLDEYYSVAKTSDARRDIRMSKSSKPQASDDRRSRSVPPKGTTRDANDDRLASLERELAKLKKSGGADVASAKYDVCGACGGLGHKSIECQSGGNGYEEVNQVSGDRNYNDMNSNTYHPGLRNHPNFKYGNASNQMNPNFQGASKNNSSYQNRQQGGNNQGGGGYQRNSYNQGGNQGYNNNRSNYQQRNYNNQEQQGGNSGGDDPVNSKLDDIMNMMKESDKKNEMRDKSVAALERQVGQLAEEVAQIKKDKGKFLSDTTLNPSH
ncbi:hypothetical protein L1987_59635 [Smallanthus sonchifolius]|uniref:Uncharacterized protein n=1 Tax=Smallanthus sonchifolius TaxID=185202 RepID=A0ACB9D6I0_9ASTR|nr:hypothetical protein L1987_59635 [Smallanthus sonchifolius]